MTSDHDTSSSCDYPEPTPEISEARKAGFATITDVGKERIRLASAKLAAAAEGQLDLASRDQAEDLGFRVYALAKSNYRSVERR